MTVFLFFFIDPFLTTRLLAGSGIQSWGEITSSGVKIATLSQEGSNDNMIPKDVTDAVEAVIACGKEVILRKEHGRWVVLENGKRLVYKEKAESEN